MEPPEKGPQKKNSFKGDLKRRCEYGWPENVDNVQTFPPSDFILLFTQLVYKKNNFLAMDLSSSGYHNVWFAVYLRGAEDDRLMTRLILLSHVPDLFMTAVVQTAWHKTAALHDFQTRFLMKQDQELSGKAAVCLFYLIYSIAIDRVCDASSCQVPFNCHLFALFGAFLEPAYPCPENNRFTVTN